MKRIIFVALAFAVGVANVQAKPVHHRAARVIHHHHQTHLRSAPPAQSKLPLEDFIPPVCKSCGECC
jgi:hypothetical protein